MVADEEALDVPRAERFTFSADDIPAPDAAQLDKYRRDAGVVRPMPYPYFQAITAASDCCATEYRNVYYTHALLSRRYGLDLPASFWPFSSSLAIVRALRVFSLFAGRSGEPLIAPVQIEGDCVDALPMVLDCYYRGWIDHVHSWSHECMPGYPLVLPLEKEFAGDGEATLPLGLTEGIGMTWEGFEVNWTSRRRSARSS